jgi:hypothetical protein
MYVVPQHDYGYSKMMIYSVCKGIFVAELIVVAVESKMHKSLYYSEQWDCESCWWHGCMSTFLCSV